MLNVNDNVVKQNYTHVCEKIILLFVVVGGGPNCSATNREQGKRDFKINRMTEGSEKWLLILIGAKVQYTVEEAQIIIKALFV